MNGRAAVTDPFLVRVGWVGNGPVEVDVTLRAVASGGEEVYLSWYSDCGRLAKSRTFGPEGGNVLRLERLDACTLYVVARSQQWGVGWRVVHLEFGP